jgi:hypothetical protein
MFLLGLIVGLAVAVISSIYAFSAGARIVARKYIDKIQRLIERLKI